MSLVSEARAKLQKIKLTKSILDDNLHVLQRQNKDAFGVGIHLYNPHVNPKLLGEESMKEIRAKKIVSETISTLSQQVKDEVESDLLAERRRPKSLRAPVVGRRPSRLILKKSSSNIPVKKSGSDHKRTFLFPGKPPPPARKPAPRRVESENDLDRIYGLGPHSNQRRTVFDPYLHITSPQKDAKYRSKRALETVNVNRVRSEKSQTENAVAYALAPPTVNYGRPLQSSAIAIGPPQIMDNDAEPVLIEAHKFSCHLSTETESLPTPPVSPIKKQPSSPPPPVVPKVSAKPVENELPGTSLNNNQEDVESSTASLPLRVQLTGSQQRPPIVVCCPDALCMLCKGIAPATCTCKNPRPPPRPASPCCCEQTVRAQRRKQPKRDPCEQEATQWVEEEVMARVLSEMYPYQSKWKLPCKGQQQQEAGYTEERGLPFVMDAGIDLPESSLKKLVDDELRDIIRQMIGDRFVPKAPSPPPSPKRTTCPMTPAPPRQDGPLVLGETPLNTPSSSPREVLQKQISIRRAKTPSVTSNEDSTDEIKVSTILDEIPPISQVDSLTCNCVKSLDGDLPTPDRTPRSSPKPPTPPGTPPPPVEKKIPPPKAEKKFVDPWEGADFPLDADANPFTRPKPDRKITYYPMDNDPCDVIVRPVTPPPRDAVVQVDSPESSSDELTETQTDQTISEGQLVISHGEIKPKKIPYLDKLMPYDDDNSLQETLRDLDGAGIGLNDEIYSDGEVNTKRVARRIPGLPAHVPSVYARPRQPLPTGPSANDLDEISVGEVVADDTKKREKFNKWKNSRKKRAAAASATASSTEDDVSVGEYNPPQAENTTAGYDVIMVAQYDDDEATDLLGTLPQNNRTLSGQFGQSLQTTGSVIPPDSLDDTGKRLVGFGTDEQQRNLPPFRILPQHEDDADDDSIEEIFS